MTQKVNADGSLSSITTATYDSLAGLRFSASGSTSNESGTVDVESVLSATGITRAALINGIFNRARVFVFMTDYTTPLEDDEKVMSGYCGETTMIDGRYVLKFSSLIGALDVTVGEKYTKLCRHVFGSEKCGQRLSVDTWVTATAYEVVTAKDARTGDWVKPTVQNGFWYKCTVAGTSGGVEPTWPTTAGNTVVDGTVTWTCVLANYTTNTVGSYNTTTRVLTLGTSLPATVSINHLRGGFVTFTSGNANRVKVRVTSNTAADVTLDLPLSVTISNGDTLTLTSGCTKRLDEDCATRYDNSYSYGGFPYIPGNINIGYIGGTK
jgi:hypothetical protein